MGIDAVSGGPTQPRRAVFLDRDGVLNEAVLIDGRPHPPASLEQLTILPGVPEALQALRQAGYLLIVATNQPDVARGTARRADVIAMNEQLQRRLGLDSIETCFHDDADRCDCRKPKPGLITGAARRFGIDTAASFMVGDRWRDIEAGRRAGCRTILVGSGYGENRSAEPDITVSSLLEGAQWILRTARSKEPADEARR